MSAVQRTRTLIAAADPVRAAVAPPPRLSAAEIIARAEATAGIVVDPGSGAATGPGPDHRPRLPRRLILVAGATAAAAVVYSVVAVTQRTERTNRPPDVDAGTVLTPVAFEIDHDPPPAAEHLREMASRLADAPYENSTGRYAHHRLKVWGDPIMTSENGRYVMGYASERETWLSPDGSGQGLVTQLAPEFPDQASRDYWTSRPGGQPGVGPGVGTEEIAEPPAANSATVPADRAGLIELLGVRHGAAAVPKPLVTIYSRNALPKRTRAQLLDILADVPGYVWRGRVTDRAGRPGVGITFDDREHDQRTLLVFDEKTGVLLAHEIVTATQRKVGTYLLILETDRTDEAR